MAIDFQSKLTDDQKAKLQTFATEEIVKAIRKEIRLTYLQQRTAAYLASLAALQTDTSQLVNNQSTKAYLDAQKAAFPPERKQTVARSGFTDPSVSEAVDRVKTPLIEAVKGRFERLEYAIRRAYDREEVLGNRAKAQSTLTADVTLALKDITTSAKP